MDEFIHDLGLILEWVDGTNDIDNFEKEFSDLVHKYRMNDEVQEIAAIIAHNYVCHKHNKKDALIKNVAHWRQFNKE